MNARIRMAAANDAAVIHDIYAYYIAHSLATFNEVNKTVAERAAEIDTLLQTYPFLVAEDEKGRFLGFANAEPFRPQSGYRFTVELTIYLHPDTPHHSGVGKLLYSHLFCILKDQGFHSAYAVLWSDNQESARLQEAFGFEPFARFEKTAYKQGQWLDSVYYRKVLNDFVDHPAPVIPFSEYRKSLSF